MNKEKIKIYLKWFIKKLAKWTIKRYQPGVIAITGSVGKTSTKEAIYAVLKNCRSVRATKGNFNNEIGLPLTILGDYQKIESKFFWVKVILISLARLIIKMKYPEILILEYAADKPGDMKYLLEIAKPQIGIVTAVGEVPAHVEFFSGPEAVAREKSKIIESLSNTGFAVLNFDDRTVLEMKQRTRAHVATFGFGSGAEVRITNFENKMSNNSPVGIAFKLNYGGSFVPVRIDGCFGKAQAYAVAAASCVGLIFGMNLVKISEALLNYQSPPQRARLLVGIKQTYIIDDSYNASPLSMQNSIEAVKSLKTKRKIGVLGDMMEIGKYTSDAHQAIGKMAGKVFDLLVTVGMRGKLIADGAARAGMPKKNIYSFDSADEAKLKVQELMKKGDLILVKASHSVGLEKVVEEIKVM
ncbi:MAG: UDP-N-acetylmuramoyl-tripeptide--D-alanyl-D-alanine ligase [Parcubacteria group bacterium Athens0714_26]|nr:MAG: UDP-N-acetylmuramoyl-tripeptide--D-alanyl-D-alanine ligase [Parcubacteria group bacterium Athens0714_26]